MRRLKDERGAVGTMVALLMIPIIGFAAISLDVAGMYAQRQLLQTGADAGALAIAQDCARGACGSPNATAQLMATQNVITGSAVTGSVLGSVSPATGSVRVETAATRFHLFAPVLGADSKTLHARAKVSWGVPTSGSVLPLAFSWCEFLAQTGGGLPSGTTERTIQFTKTSQTSCTGPSNNVVPGGFGWLTVNAGSCRTSSAIGNNLLTEPGNSPPSSCSPSDFQAMQNQTVLLPIFDVAGGTGSGAWYHVYGYAAFRIAGYYFNNSFAWNPRCSGNNRCITGYFTRFVDLTEAFKYGTNAPALGVSVVSLTE